MDGNVKFVILLTNRLFCEEKKPLKREKSNAFSFAITL
jgi:hypothetical protein